MSALATIFGSLGELSESELRQLYLAIGVRLGIPDVPPGAKPQGRKARKSGPSKQTSGKTGSSAANASSKGNPQRKSQWANHPLYQEYSRLKKVVENQAKESNLSFNAVDTAESSAYRDAFTRWVEAKHSFRGHGESGQIRGNPEGEESDEESGPAPPPKAATSAPKQAKPASPQGASPGPAGKSSKVATVPASGKGKAPAK